MNKPIWQVPTIKLRTEDQQELWKLLLKLLATSKRVEFKSISSHEDEYLKLQEKLSNLGISYIDETYSVGGGGHYIRITFEDILGYLLDFNKINFND